MELVEKKEFAATVLNPKYENYVVYVASLSFTPLIASLGSTPLDIHPFWRLQISGLIAKKAFTKVLDEYVNFANVFFPDLVSKLLKYIGIKNHAIKLVDS